MDRRRTDRRSPQDARAVQAARLEEFGPTRQNPGNLRGLHYIPPNLSPAAALVVVLHGCSQTAADYDRGSGWSQLAERQGFALLFPEQKQGNNGSLCFNWFAAGDSQRGMGEPASIAAMIDALVATHSIDPRRVHVTGLSAGGAMASVMLAAYPEKFAAGAIIAGLPYGCATNVRQAFDCMGGRAQAQAVELAASVRRASPYKGIWPRISVWQGDADRTVAPSNAEAIVLQWTHLHRLSPVPTYSDTVDGYPHQAWLDDAGAIVVERYAITGMAHGTPLMPGDAPGELGVAGAHMLDARINSTALIAAFFGILGAQGAATAGPPARLRGRSMRSEGSKRPAVSTAGHGLVRDPPSKGLGITREACGAAGLRK